MEGGKNNAKVEEANKQPCSWAADRFPCSREAWAAHSNRDGKLLRADAQEKEGEDPKREGAVLAIPRRGGREGLRQQAAALGVRHRLCETWV